MTRRNLLSNYKISKHRFMELMYFCLQYDEWKWVLENVKTDGIRSPQISDMPKARGLNRDMTSELGIDRAELEHNCMLIEDSARAADEDLCEYILYAVTHEDVTYNYLSTVKHIPCSKNTWYKVRRRFYYLLSKKKGK